MFSTSELTQRIETRLAKLSFNRPPAALYEPIAYSLQNGGKRIRPLLTLMACNMFSDTIDNALNPALGLEVFHNFTLLHDDLMDNAPLRRNQPTVHVKWGANTAILSGDAMMMEANKLICEAPATVLNPVLRLFNQTAIEVCEGQMFDMQFESFASVTEAEYLEMIRLKTAVLIGASLQMGALIGGANSTNASLMYQYGINLGLSFQLLDDWLDTFGDEQTFGKKIGGDIACNKKTFLLVKAFELASGNQKIELQQWLNTPMSDAKLQGVKELYNNLNIGELSLAKADAFWQKAQANLADIQVEASRKQALADIGAQLLKRTK